ncbi:unnamed protein product [Effrenium voratum]|uniref:NFX1-type zinc finger-containing protein 1 n=1 Tax=Effrenium voratum TaxID=2562239 RepID=A0AA36NI17_9DINO|nr:unnamed protein product [Effrenium voratum]
MRGWAESSIGEVAVVKENEKGRFGFIKAERFSKDLYFKLEQVTCHGGLELRRGDQVRFWCREWGDVSHVSHVELTKLAGGKRRRLDALQQMEVWRGKLQGGHEEESEAVLEAGSCLAAWRAVSALLAEALSEQWSALAPADEMETDEATARVSGQSSKRGPEHKILEQVTHEGADLRESMPFKEKTMPVDEVFFTHGQVSPQFRNGGSLTQLLGDLRRGRLLPQTDPRLRLDVVKLAKVRSVNNRRLWVLKEFQQELRRHRPKSDTVKVAVRLHPLCKGTAKFLSELCNAAACSEKEQPDIHPEDNTRRTLLNISSAALEDGVVCRWVLESRAEERSKVPVNDLTYLGAPNSVGVKRRRCGGVAGSAVPPLTRQQREACERVEQGERVDAVQFDGKLFVVDRDLGQALYARQQQGRQICAEVRVIPLCPMTAKFVMANSSSNNGKSVDIRGTLQANAEWPLDRIVMVVLSLALRLSNCPRAPDIYGVLASSRLLGERSALISAIRSKRRFAKQVQEQVWPFMQQVMRMQASKFNMAMPVCKFLANDRHGREGAVGSELLALLDRAAQQLADQPDPTNTAWHCLPATPTAEEITRLQILPDGKQRFRALDLPVVRQVGSYRSTSDYLDTYFRLLREDCISSLRKSLADLRDRGEQAQHAQEEGNAFRAKLKGFTAESPEGVVDSRVKVVLKIFPLFSSRRLRSGKYFMPGNLVACVCGGDFSVPLWLLAAKRSPDGREVVLDIYSEHLEDEASLLARLWSASSLTLVASPTYFRSFEPVLKALKTAETVGLPFQKELVRCQGTSGSSCLHLADRPVDRSLIFQDQAPCVTESHQLVGLSDEVLGKSWTFGTEAAPTEIVAGSFRFAIWSEQEFGGGFACRNHSNVQILVVFPSRVCPVRIGLDRAVPAQTELAEEESLAHLLKPGASIVDLPLNTEIVSSTGQHELRFRIVALRGSVQQLQRDLGTAIKQPDGALAKSTTWDESQLRAAQHALQCRLALIQGPPGTGKTFIGFKLLQLLLPQSRALVMTYKNHALDDFLQHCVEAGYTDQLARIGGRSNEDSQELQACNLRSLKRKALSKTQSLAGTMQQLASHSSHAKVAVNEAKQKMLEALRNYRQRGVHTVDTFLAAASSRQLGDLISNFWTHGQRRREHREIAEAWEEVGQENWPNLAQRMRWGTSWAYERLRGFLDQALLAWYPDNSIISQVAASYVTGRMEPDTAEDDSEMWSQLNDSERVLIQTQAEADKVISSCSEDGHVRQTITIRRGVTIEQGWMLSACQDPSGSGISLGDLRSRLPATLVFDDEAERELQNEMEMERLESAGHENRDGRQGSEPDVSAHPENAQRPCLPHLPGKIQLENMDERLLWWLGPEERAHVLVQQILQQASRCFQDLQNAATALAAACRDEEAMDVSLSAEIMRSKRIIGMTVTGASINAALLSQIKPDVVIVEEAAEVLEPQIMAVLGPWVKQLILIGDDRQLPPPVETYTLKQNHLFDTSMLERLILNNLPNVELCRQGRMLPSLSKLLKPIYPHLEDNMKVVGKLAGPACVESEEETQRSKVNKAECDRAVQLVCFFISQGYEPSKITVLAAYQAQASLVHREVRQKLPRFLENTGWKHELSEVQVSIDSSLLKRGNRVDVTDRIISEGRVVSTSGGMVKAGRYVAKGTNDNSRADGKVQMVQVLLQPEELQPNEMPEVSTIDRYQGAENEIVIISLVRSNEKNKLGFLGTEDGKNRMCVAQSRAKCGLYFIGNAQGLRTSAHWKELLDTLQERACVGHQFPQRCPRHPEVKKYALEAADVGVVCKQVCGKAFGCGNDDHTCKLPCHPDESGTRHARDKCHHLVDKVYICKESPAHVFNNVECRIRTEELSCPFRESLDCQRSEHKVIRKCGEDKEVIIASCKQNCTTQLGCGHMCPKKCCEDCIPESECQVPKEFDCPEFPQHKRIKSACSSSSKQLLAKCWSRCSRQLPCGHYCSNRCCDPCVTLCEKPCNRKLECEHKCQMKCKEACKCTRPKTVSCARTQKSETPHQVRGECYEEDASIAARCQEACGSPLSCGHLCQKPCGECRDLHTASGDCRQQCANVLECCHPCGRPCQHQEPCGRVCPNCATPKAKAMPKPQVHLMPARKAMPRPNEGSQAKSPMSATSPADPASPRSPASPISPPHVSGPGLVEKSPAVLVSERERAHHAGSFRGRDSRRDSDMPSKRRGPDGRDSRPPLKRRR